MNLLEHAPLTQFIPDPDYVDDYNITDDDLAMTISDCRENVNFGMFVDDDGYGEYAYKIDNKWIKPGVYISPSEAKTAIIPPEITHIIWYNR